VDTLSSEPSTLEVCQKDGGPTRIYFDKYQTSYDMFLSCCVFLWHTQVIIFSCLVDAFFVIAL
jgi:hypothetical protein